MSPFDRSEISLKLSEAAFIPDAWPEVLARFAALTHAHASAMQIYWPEFKFVLDGSGRLVPLVTPPKRIRQQAQKVLTRVDSRAFEKPYEYMEAVGSIDRYREHLRSRNIGDLYFASFRLFNGEAIGVDVKRELGSPEFSSSEIENLNRLYESIERSLLFASRLSFEIARGTIETMAKIGIPGALINAGGQIVHNNELFGMLDGIFASLPGERFAIRGDRAAQSLLARALTDRSLEGASVSIARTEDRDPVLLNLLTLQGVTRDIFSSSHRMLIVTPVTATRRVPTREVLASLFGLTPSEAQIAISLASGLSIRDSAAKSMITIGTARGYLHQIFIKTGTRSQGHLVGLLKGIAPV